VKWSKETAHLFPDVRERFFRKVELRGRDECWSWTGGKFQGGSHGNLGKWPSARFDVQKGGSRFYFQAHRFMWAIYHGPVADDVEIRRSCLDPNCVNPNCMEMGDRQDTTDAMVERGTTAIGNSHAKKHDHVAMFADYESGMSYGDLMQKYGIKSKGTISYIIRKQRTLKEESE